MDGKNGELLRKRRELCRQRFVEEGFANADDESILDLLLSFAISQKDTSSAAHELIRRFGSFSAVFSADIEQTKALEGMTQDAAILLKMLPQIYSRYIEDRFVSVKAFSSPDLMGEFLAAKFIGLPIESIGVLYFDGSRDLIKFEWLSEGGLSSAAVGLRRLAKAAFSCNAAGVVIAHNHPSGSLMPSEDDIQTTRYIRDFLQKLDITLWDHFIIAGDKWRSMMSSL